MVAVILACPRPGCPGPLVLVDHDDDQDWYECVRCWTMTGRGRVRLTEEQRRELLDRWPDIRERKRRGLPLTGPVEPDVAAEP